MQNHIQKKRFFVLESAPTTAPKDEILFSKKKVLKVKIASRLPAIAVKDLALMLQIDLALGRKKDFTARLQKALDAVYEAAQG